MDIVKDLAIGSIAGMSSKVIEYPFDTIKVRLQSQPDDRPLRFRGPLDCLEQSLAADGFRGLYRGLPAPLLGCAAENATLFFSYNVAQKAIQTTFYQSEKDLPIAALAVCGGVAGAFTSLVLTPIELVKCKIQVQALGLSDQRVALLNETRITATHASQIIYKKPAVLVADVIRVYGVAGLWRGYTGAFFRESGGNAAWFGTYEYVSSAFRAASNKESNTAAETMLSGVAAGWLYNFALFPADTVKSRMQIEAVGSMASERKGFFTIAAGIYLKGGIVPFYRGCGVTLMKSAPASATIFLVYETLKSYW